MVKNLTEEQKEKIYYVIYEEKLEDDLWPQEVIKDKFGGDENAYLLKMAKWHNISI